MPATQQPRQYEPACTTRRGVIAGFAGLASFATMPAFATSDIAKQFASGDITKAEYNQLLADRKEAERVAALPANLLKGKRDELASAEALINAGSWSELRDKITAATGTSLNEIMEKVSKKNDDAKSQVVAIRKAMYNVDLVAYKEVDFFGNLGKGWCAEGVAPRGDDGCKVKPTVDKAPLIADLKKALAAFDKLIATV